VAVPFLVIRGEMLRLFGRFWKAPVSGAVAYEVFFFLKRGYGVPEESGDLMLLTPRFIKLLMQTLQICSWISEQPIIENILNASLFLNRQR